MEMYTYLGKEDWIYSLYLLTENNDEQNFKNSSRNRIW